MRFKVPRLRIGLAAAIPPIVFLALLPLIGAPQSWLLYTFLFFVYLAMANMWNLLAGYSGLISLCQPAFLGLAGYTLAIGTWVGIPWWVGLPCGALVAALFALLISIPVFELSGIYFAIHTRRARSVEDDLLFVETRGRPNAGEGARAT